MDQERLSAIWARTVEKLQEVVREFGITEDELHQAGRYFDRLGQVGMCCSLIDVALAMTSVDVAAAATGGTRPNLEGPYYAVHPLRADGNLIEREPGADVARLSLSGDVTDAVTGCAIPGARLDFWQADDGGLYDRKGSHLRGVVITDAQGHYRITTVLPNDYSEHDQDPIGELFRAMGRTNTRAAHIHVKVTVDGELLLTTQLFMPTSHFLDRDYVEGAVSDDLIVKLEPDPAAPAGVAMFRARFDLAVVPHARSTAA